MKQDELLLVVVVLGLAAGGYEVNDLSKKLDVAAAAVKVAQDRVAVSEADNAVYKETLHKIKTLVCDKQ